MEADVRVTARLSSLAAGGSAARGSSELWHPPWRAGPRKVPSSSDGQGSSSGSSAALGAPRFPGLAVARNASPFAVARVASLPSLGANSGGPGSQGLPSSGTGRAEFKGPLAPQQGLVVGLQRVASVPGLDKSTGSRGSKDDTPRQRPGRFLQAEPGGLRPGLRRGVALGPPRPPDLAEHPDPLSASDGAAALRVEAGLGTANDAGPLDTTQRATVVEEVLGLGVDEGRVAQSREEGAAIFEEASLDGLEGELRRRATALEEANAVLRGELEDVRRHTLNAEDVAAAQVAAKGARITSLEERMEVVWRMLDDALLEKSMQEERIAELEHRLRHAGGTTSGVTGAA